MSRFFKDGRNHFYYGLLGVAILGACLSVALGCGTHSGNPTLTETGYTPAGVVASPSPSPSPTSTASAM